MTELRTYFVLAAYPAIIMFVWDWGSPGWRWAKEHRSSVLPPDLTDTQERRGRFLLLIKYALALLALGGLGYREQWRHAFTSPHPRPWLTLFAAGLLSGLIAFGFRRMLAALALSDTKDYLLRGPITSWLTIFALGAFAEELWRALCISGFQHNGYSRLLADALPAVLFSIAHMSGLPSRIPAGLEIAGGEIIVGLIFGALFIWSGSIASPCLASITFYTLTLFWLRQHYVLASKHAAPVIDLR